MLKKLILIAFIIPILLLGILIGVNIEHMRQEPAPLTSYESGEYRDKRWNLDEASAGDTTTVCVPDLDSAVTISNLIFSNLKKKGGYSDYILQSMFYDESDHVWIATYFIDKKNYTGSDLCIAISEETAEVLKIWARE